MSTPQPPPPPPMQPQLTYIGDIGVTPTHVVLPQGTFPIKGSQWHVQDATMAVEKTSQLGIILAAVGFFVVCVFSLFFLLMKETKVGGVVQVSVSGDGFQHTTVVAAQGPETIVYVTQLVTWARSLSA